MLQFDKNKPNNTNAVYIEVPSTASGFYDSVVVVASQSYDNSNSSFRVEVTSAPTIYRNWLIFTNSCSLVPSSSGQYDIDIFEGSLDSEGRWDFATGSWQAVDGKWESFGEGGVPLGLALARDRAYISGSNESTITQYVSPDETGTYTTYNG